MDCISDSTRCQRNAEFVLRSIAGESVRVAIRQRTGDLETNYILNEHGHRSFSLFGGIPHDPNASARAWASSQRNGTRPSGSPVSSRAHPTHCSHTDVNRHPRHVWVFVRGRCRRAGKTSCQPRRNEPTAGPTPGCGPACTASGGHRDRCETSGGVRSAATRGRTRSVNSSYDIPWMGTQTARPVPPCPCGLPKANRESVTPAISGRTAPGA